MIEQNEKRAILIGAGEIADGEVVVRKGDYVIAMDGGLMYCVEHNIEPAIIVGDFDSLPLAEHILLEKYPDEIIVRLPCEKDDTDTLMAVKLAMEKGYDSFIIYGGLGGRLSHTMANVQTLFYLKEKRVHAELVGNGGKVFLLKNESCTLSEEESGYVSVFAYLEKAEGVTLKNLKYEIEGATLSNTFPVGVSNEFIGKEAEISVKEGVLLVITEK